jgi:hypothetical protein
LRSSAIGPTQSQPCGSLRASVLKTIGTGRVRSLSTRVQLRARSVSYGIYRAASRCPRVHLSLMVRSRWTGLSRETGSSPSVPAEAIAWLSHGLTGMIEAMAWRVSMALSSQNAFSPVYVPSSPGLMLPSGLPEHVADEEYLARFLVQKNQFTASSVKPSAFLPSPRDRETSVSRHGREPIEQLWELGTAAAVGRPLYGAAIVKTVRVRAAQLDVLSDEPPDRHAVIRGWPWLESAPDLQKAQQKERALSLASAAGPPVLRQR